MVSAATDRLSCGHARQWRQSSGLRHINHLKLLNRQMRGCAHFDPLCARVCLSLNDKFHQIRGNHSRPDSDSVADDPAAQDIFMVSGCFEDVRF